MSDKMFYGSQEVKKDCLYILSNGTDQFIGMIMRMKFKRNEFWVFNGFNVDDQYRSHLPFKQGLDKNWEIHSWEMLDCEGLHEWVKIKNKLPCKPVNKGI